MNSNPIRGLVKRIFTEVPWGKAKQVAVACRLTTRRTMLFSLAHICLSALNAAADGAGLLLLLDLVTGRWNSGVMSASIIRAAGSLGFEISYTGLYSAAIALILGKGLLTLAMSVMDGYLEAIARRKIQTVSFSRLAGATWESLRGIKVGERLGAATEEAAKLALFYASIVRALYSFCAAGLLFCFSLAVNPEMTLLAIVAAVPAAMLLRGAFNWQARIVRDMVSKRQAFYGAVSERLNALFHIKAEGDPDFHVAEAMRDQPELTSQELLFWRSRAAIMSINVSIPALVLITLYIWIKLSGGSLQDTMYYLAGVGVVGARTLTYANLASSNIANITGLSGSIPPVHALIALPQEQIRGLVPEPIRGVSASGLAYDYGPAAGIHGISLEIVPGRPLLITGPSGCGKTTLANLIAGILPPHKGKVEYIGASGRSYHAADFRARIAYVTQDVTLFNGTVRSNLLPAGDRKVQDNELWAALRRCGAEDFVSALGGLDAQIAESGRSLSGGQKRRLAIARAVAASPQVLILDEITAGLDEERKAGIADTVNSIAAEIPVVVIAHEDAGLRTENRLDYYRGDYVRKKA